jgi:hypothetical protein
VSDQSHAAYVRELAKSARATAAAPDYDEQAIKEALWAVVDAVLAPASADGQRGREPECSARGSAERDAEAARLRDLETSRSECSVESGPSSFVADSCRHGQTLYCSICGIDNRSVASGRHEIYDEQGYPGFAGLEAIVNERTSSAASRCTWRCWECWKLRFKYRIWRLTERG